MNKFSKEDAAELRKLHTNLEKAQEQAEKLELIERDIIQILDRNKCYKVEFKKDNVYSVKDLKSGGPGGRGRRVLRRDK